mmetsp:Transcript_3768/g.9405  ORF Transcript_3768/g.9405 Transcript_3768/m.9405 type:complete len:464 (+) Transcript_3768:312-1703(+)
MLALLLLVLVLVLLIAIVGGEELVEVVENGHERKADGGVHQHEDALQPEDVVLQVLDHHIGVLLAAGTLLIEGMLDVDSNVQVLGALHLQLQLDGDAFVLAGPVNIAHAGVQVNHNVHHVAAGRQRGAGPAGLHRQLDLLDRHRSTGALPVVHAHLVRRGHLHAELLQAGGALERRHCSRDLLDVLQQVGHQVQAEAGALVCGVTGANDCRVARQQVHVGLLVKGRILHDQADGLPALVLERENQLLVIVRLDNDEDLLRVVRVHFQPHGNVGRHGERRQRGGRLEGDGHLVLRLPGAPLGGLHAAPVPVLAVIVNRGIRLGGGGPRGLDGMLHGTQEFHLLLRDCQQLLVVVVAVALILGVIAVADAALVKPQLALLRSLLHQLWQLLHELLGQGSLPQRLGNLGRDLAQLLYRQILIDLQVKLQNRILQRLCRVLLIAVNLKLKVNVNVQIIVLAIDAVIL